MNVAYIRVSSTDQNPERQYEAMKKLPIDRYYEEKVSAKDANRPKLQEMLEYVREGDSIYILDFSRLARSTKDLLDITELLKRKNVALVSLKEGVDSNTPMGKFMLTMIGAINELERANIKERQREGIKIAKGAGKYKGRKPVPFPKNWNEVYPKWKQREITGAEAMKLMKLKRNTFYRLVKQAAQ